MSENWKFMLSLKGNEPLLVTRGDTIEEFVENLHRLEENKEPISLVIASYATRKPEPVRPASAPAQRPIVSQKASGAPGEAPREVGPVYLSGVEMKKGPTVKNENGDFVPGKPWKSPMYIVKWDDNNESASTFDAGFGKAAMTLWSEAVAVYVTIEPSQKDPRYSNLVSIRSAVAA